MIPLLIAFGIVGALGLATLLRQRQEAPQPPQPDDGMDGVLPGDTTPIDGPSDPAPAPQPPEVVAPPPSTPGPTPDPVSPPKPATPAALFDVGDRVRHVSLSKEGVVKARSLSSRTNTWSYQVDFGSGAFWVDESKLRHSDASQQPVIPTAPAPKPQPSTPPADPGVTTPTRKFNKGDVLVWQIGPVRQEVTVRDHQYARPPYPTEWSYEVVRVAGVPFWTRESTLRLV